MVTEEGISIEVNEEQFSKALFSIDSTDDGILKLVNDEQFAKQLELIVFNKDVMIFNCFKLEHPLNEQLPIERTEEGISIEVNEEHLLKASSLIDSTDDGI